VCEALAFHAIFVLWIFAINSWQSYVIIDNTVYGSKGWWSYDEGFILRISSIFVYIVVLCVKL
jgi:hypothetical protein